MSIKVQHLVWQNAKDLQGSELLIMLALADWSNDFGHCWPSMDTLAEKARVSTRTAQYVLKRLQDRGYIGIEAGTGRKNTNHYLLNMTKLSAERVQVLHPSIPERVQVATYDEKGASDAERVQVATLKGASDDIKGAIAIAPEPLYTSVKPSLTDMDGPPAPPTSKPEIRPVPKSKPRNPSSTQQATSIPANYAPTPPMLAAAREKYPGLDLEDATEEWTTSMRSNTVKYRYTDWNAAWWNAMKRAAKWAAERGGKANGKHTESRFAVAARNHEELGRIMGARSDTPDNPRLLRPGPTRT